jgi:hypothetical protein
MNKNIALAGIATTIVAGVLAAPVAASAATVSPKVVSTTSCGEVKVALKNFPVQAKSNSVQATIDGTKVVDYRFGSTYSFVFYVGTRSAHTVTVNTTDRTGVKTTQVIKTVRCSFPS